jgi:hypothetical protein
VGGTAVSVIVAGGVLVGIFVGIVVGMGVIVAGAGSFVAVDMAVGVVFVVIETAVSVTVGDIVVSIRNCFEKIVRPENNRKPITIAPINRPKAPLPEMFAICLLSFIREV